MSMLFVISIAGVSLVAQMVNLLQCRRPKFDPWVRKIPWKKEWLPTVVFFPGESHGQRSLVGYSPWGHKESDTTERLTHTHTHPPTHTHTVSGHEFLLISQRVSEARRISMSLLHVRFLEKHLQE